MTDTKEDIIEQTQYWVEQAVVGLSLCPFARPVVDDGSLRLSVCETEHYEKQLKYFLQELDLIQQSDEADIATSLLILPKGLENFDDYLDLLADAEYLIEEAGLADQFQLASFHPDYLFEGEGRR